MMETAEDQAEGSVQGESEEGHEIVIHEPFFWLQLKYLWERIHRGEMKSSHARTS